MSQAPRIAAFAGFICFALCNIGAFAEDHAYSEGPVVSVSSIRTADGKFDDYMKFVDSNWKQQQEQAKKAGDVLSYQVLNVIPRGPDDPDLLLVVTYKNWAAGIDGALQKSDAIEDCRWFGRDDEPRCSQSRLNPTASRYHVDAGAESQMSIYNRTPLSCLARLDFYGPRDPHRSLGNLRNA